jgi:hypothetical protein
VVTIGQLFDRINWLSARIDAYQAVVMSALKIIQTKETTIMATLTDVQDAVTAETTVEQSVILLLQGLSTQLAAALAANDPAAIQAIVDSINANSAALSAAVTANTPVAPPAPAPTPAP